jgi:hypothetical protein
MNFMNSKADGVNRHFIRIYDVLRYEICSALLEPAINKFYVDLGVISTNLELG